MNFKSLVQNSPDLIYCLDSNSKIIFINDSAKKYGYSANELIGKDILEIIHPEDHNIAQYRINERRTGERRTKSLELRLLDKNNLARDFDIKFTGLEHTFLSVDSEGVYDSNSETKFIGTQGIARDITKRVQAEEALRESENKYRMLTECTNNIVFSIDANGIINYIGPQIYRLGYKPSEIIAKSFLNFIHPDDRDHTQQDFVRTMSSGEEFISQFRIIDRSGNALWFEEYGRVQKDNDGRITGVIGVLHDITEQKGYEQALIKSEKQHRDFYNTALAGMFRISINTGKIIKANDKFLELFGFEDIESFNKTWKKDSSYYLRGR
ncbi:MAG: PAS domain S-box protein, partial [bacterium]|nr:PAS domain S-box protein [bacterium]